MKVILLERVERLGALGEVVSVKDGFARNYLLPRNQHVFVERHVFPSSIGEGGVGHGGSSVSGDGSRAKSPALRRRAERSAQDRLPERRGR